MRWLLSVVLVIVCGPAWAQTGPAAPLAPTQAAATAVPMRFQWVREGPACGDRCREWISAAGDITPESGRDFAFFAQARDLQGATVVLDSPGGSVRPALALGRAFRKYGLTVTVGRTVKIATEDADIRAELSPRGVCASMCPFVLLGGVKRQVPPQARVLVHQIWPRAKRADAYAEAISAEELASIQRDAGLLAKYVVEMGGDIELFEMAMRMPPWERLRPLNEAEMRRMRLINDGSAEAAAAASVPPMTEGSASALRADPAWRIEEVGGKFGLRRRSPITIEGEPVGSFEIAFACGEQAGNYAVDYAETRRAPIGANGDRLRRVVMAVGSARAALKVESSLAEAGGELRSTARAIVPESLIRALAQPDGKSLLVGTQTTRNVEAVIRLGTVGFAQNYALLADRCPK